MNGFPHKRREVVEDKSMGFFFKCDIIMPPEAHAIVKRRVHTKLESQEPITVLVRQ